MNEYLPSLFEFATYSKLFGRNPYPFENIINALKKYNRKKAVINLLLLNNAYHKGDVELKSNIMRKYISTKYIYKCEFTVESFLSLQCVLNLLKLSILFCEEEGKYELTDEEIIHFTVKLGDYQDQEMDRIDSYLTKNINLNQDRGILLEVFRAKKLFIDIPKIFNHDFEKYFREKKGYSFYEYVSCIHSIFSLFCDKKYSYIDLNIFYSNSIKNELFSTILNNDIAGEISYYRDWTKSSMESYWDISKFQEKPMIKFNNEIYPISKNLIINLVFEKLFYDFQQCYPGKSEEYLEFMGNCFEKYCLYLYESINLNEYKIIKEFKFGKSKSDSSDLYLYKNNKMIIFELKSARPRVETYKNYTDMPYENEIEKLIIDPIQQANDCYLAVRDCRKNIDVNIKSIFSRINEIFIITVSYKTINNSWTNLKKANDISEFNLDSTIKKYYWFDIIDMETLSFLINSGEDIFEFLTEYFQIINKHLSKFSYFASSKNNNKIYTPKYIVKEYEEIGNIIKSTLSFTSEDV